MPQNRLKILREGLGWDRHRLAAFLDVSERTVYRYEAGESQVPDAVKARLCDLFGVSLDHLMGFDNGESRGDDA